MSQGSVSSIGFLAWPRWTPYCFAPVTRRMRWMWGVIWAVVRAVRKLESMVPLVEVSSSGDGFWR